MGLFNTLRSWITQPSLNIGGERKAYSAVKTEPWTDLTKSKRQQIVTLADVIKNTVPDMKSIEDRLVRYTVGTGLRPSVKTGEETFDSQVNEFLELYAGDRERADVTAKFDFYGLQKKIAKELLTPGEAFILLVKSNSSSTTYRRSHQWIDPNRIHGD